MSTQEADAALVQARTNEIIMGHFMPIITCFACLISGLALTMVGLWVWLVVAFARSEDETAYPVKECDVPLWTWAVVVIAMSAVRQLAKFIIDRCICCWHPQVPNEKPPLRVVLKDWLILAFEFVWIVILGFHWINQDGLGDKPPCKDVAPDLFKAAKVYIAVNMATTIFVWTSTVGMVSLLAWMMRRGMLKTSDSVPQEVFEKATEQIAAQELGDTPSCPICIGDFVGSTKSIAKVRVCGHVYHTACLRSWLNASNTCPVCRADVTVIPTMWATPAMP